MSRQKAPPPAWIAAMRRFDASHVTASTGYAETWDGIFGAVCPHGRDVQWSAEPWRLPEPLCRCKPNASA